MLFRSRVGFQGPRARAPSDGRKSPGPPPRRRLRPAGHGAAAPRHRGAGRYQHAGAHRTGYRDALSLTRRGRQVDTGATLWRRLGQVDHEPKRDANPFCHVQTWLPPLLHSPPGAILRLGGGLSVGISGAAGQARGQARVKLHARVGEIGAGLPGHRSRPQAASARVRVPARSARRPSPVKTSLPGRQRAWAGAGGWGIACTLERPARTLEHHQGGSMEHRQQLRGRTPGPRARAPTDGRKSPGPPPRRRLRPAGHGAAAPRHRGAGRYQHASAHRAGYRDALSAPRRVNGRRVGGATSGVPGFGRRALRA